MKKKKSDKLRLVKSDKLRVYKDNARPAVFEDKRRKEKHKQKYNEDI